MEKVTTQRDATAAEARAIQEARAILNAAGLELIGTRPKDRG